MMKKPKDLLPAARRKLSGSAGESIAETLIALLISSVAIVMMAGMILTSSRIVQSSKVSLNADYAGSSALETRSDTDAGTACAARLSASGAAVQLVPGEASVDVSVFESDGVYAYAIIP